jgi:hypothetical protein
MNRITTVNGKIDIFWSPFLDRKIHEKWVTGRTFRVTLNYTKQLVQRFDGLAEY